MRNFRLRFFIVFVTLILSLMSFSNVNGKYVTTLESLNLALDIKARFNVSFDSDGGIIEVPEVVESPWTSYTSTSANKVLEVNDEFGDLPIISKDGYAFNGWYIGGLPLEYQEVEYIESTGTQYIDTGYIPESENIKVHCIFKENKNGDMNVIGSYAGPPYEQGEERRAYPVSVYNGRIFYGITNENVGLTTSPFTHNTTDYYDVTTVFKNGEQYMNVVGFDGELKSNKTYETLDNGNTWYIFARQESTKLTCANSMRLKVIEIYEENELVHKYVPCYKKLENDGKKPGLYDVVEGDFFENKGSNEFNIGPDVLDSDLLMKEITSDTVFDKSRDVVIKPVFTPITHKITIKVNKGSGSTNIIGASDNDEITVSYGDTYHDLPTLTRIGYDFVGWFDEDNNEYKKEDTVELEKDITLYAKWNAKDVTLVFNSNSEDVEDPESRTIKFDDYLTDLPVLERLGYDQLGWSLDYIPEQYQEVEYLESFGNEYIDLGYIPNSNNVTTRVILSETTTGDMNVIGSCKNSNPYDRVYPISVINGKFFFGLYEHNFGYDSGTAPSNFAYELNKFYDVNVEYKSGSQAMSVKDLDGNKLADDLIWNKEYTTLNNNNSWYIFARNQSNLVYCKNKMKLKLAQIYEDDILVHEYKPVYLKSDSSVRGLYDTVTGYFFANIGGGQFGIGDDVIKDINLVDDTTRITSLGIVRLNAIWAKHKYNITFDANGGTIEVPEVVESPWTSYEATSANKLLVLNDNYGELPTISKTGYTFDGWYNTLSRDGYFSLDYIQSDGTQIINTGYKPTNKTAYEIKYSGYEIPTTNSEHILFGAGSSWTELVGVNNSKNGNRSNTIPYILYDGVSCTLEQQQEATYYLDSTGLYMNGSSTPVFAKTASEFDWTTKTDEAYSISIFGVNKSWNAAIKNVAMKLHYFKIYEDNELVFNGIPSYYNNKYGLYDTVNKQFYTNTIGNEFTGSNLEDIRKITSDSIFTLAKDQTLYAKFEPKHFTLTLDANDEEYIDKAIGNTPSGTLEVVYDSTYKDLPTLSLSGCEFLGWYDDKQEGNKVEPNSIVKITEDKTLYAHYLPGTYTVNFDSNCDELENPEPISVTYGSKYENLPVLERKGYDFMGWSGFEMLDYIQSDGTQIINTGYKPTNKTSYEIKYSGYEIPTENSEHILFGAGNSWLEVVGVNNSKNGNRSNTIPYVLYDGVNSPLAQQSEATYYLDSTGLYVNGNDTPAFAKTASEFDWTSKTDDAYSISIFGVNKSWNAAIKNVAMKLHYFKIFEDGILVFNGVPCYYNSKYGLYDTINKQFYTNVTGNEFKGPKTSNITTVTNDSIVTTINDLYLLATWKEHIYNLTFDANGGTITSPSEVDDVWNILSESSVSKKVAYLSSYDELPVAEKADYEFVGWANTKLPDEYQEVEYIESTSGGQQYIDTGLCFDVNNKYEVSTRLLQEIGGNHLFGADGSGRNIIYLGGSSYFCGDNFTISISKNKDYKLNIDLLESTKKLTVFEDNTQTLYKENTGGIDNKNNKIYLFCTSRDSSINSFNYQRYYSFKVSNSKGIVQELVPCYRKEDNVVGMYDLVTKNFYTNGKGLEAKDFNKGPDVEPVIINSGTILNETKDLIYKAKWELKNITIHFDAVGGELVGNENKVVTIGEALGELPTVTKQGYEFVSWSRARIPSEYHEVEYLESTLTGQQYIDTGLKFKLGYKFDLNTRLLQRNNNSALFGFEASGSNLVRVLKADGNSWFCGKNYKGSVPSTIKDYHIVADLISNPRVLTINDEIIESVTDGTINPDNRSVFLFGSIASQANTSTIDSFNVQRVYSFKVYDDTGLIKDYIPCYRVADEKPGFYDLVNDEFVANGNDESSEDFESGLVLPYDNQDETTIVPSSTGYTLYATWNKIG